MQRLAKQLGPQDRDRVNQYLESIREVERRIEKAQAAVAVKRNRSTTPPVQRLRPHNCRP
jgi:hypothetical protein